MVANLDLKGQAFPEWRADDPSGSLSRCYTAVEARAISISEWYMRERRSRSRLSKSFRAATLALVAMGADVAAS